MAREITHQVVDGRMVQVVPPARLREILDSDGESYDRPDDFGPDDEWQVDDVPLDEPIFPGESASAALRGIAPVEEGKMMIKHPNALAREHQTLCLVRPGASPHWERGTLCRQVQGWLGEYDTMEPIERLVVSDRDTHVPCVLPVVDVGTVIRL